MNRELTALKEEHLEPLVERALDHDVRAWKAVWSALEPAIDAIARRRPLTSRLCTQADERRDIVVSVMAGLREDGFRGLRELLACLRQRDGSFRYWLTAVARNAAVSHTRAHPENIGGKKRFRWVKHSEVPTDLEDGRRDAFQSVVARQVLAIAERRLDEKQRRVLLMWASGKSYREIADALGLGSAAEAERVRRAACERLRYHCEHPEEEEEEQPGIISSTRPDGSPPEGV